MRQLEESVRAAPTAAPYANLAKFLAEESDLQFRGENVEPRHGLVPYRWQLSPEAELRRAVAVCDEGLRAVPGSIAIQTAKATGLVRLGADSDAELIVNRVLAAAPRNPEALRMRATFLMDRANAMFSRASSLRTPTSTSSSHNETRSDGVYEVTTTTNFEPSQSDLNTAAQLEAQAQALVRSSNAAISAALSATRGTLDGYLLAADVDKALGRRDAAFADLGSALKLQPRSLAANGKLAEFYRRTGQTDEADRQRSVTTNMVHTNSGWMLRLAWRKIVASDSAGAAAALEAARRADPTDARVPAYRGSILARQGDVAGANAQYRVAMALEQARLRLDEGKDAASMPRDPQELALLLWTRNRIGASLLASDPQAALGYYGPNSVLASRITRSGRAAQMFGAMIPEPGMPAIPVPSPPNAATLMAEAYNGAGRALKALGRSQEATQQFQLAIDLTAKRGIPGIGSGRPGDSNFAGNAGGGVTAEAHMEMIRAALDRGDCRGALEALQRGTEARFPPQMRDEVTRVPQQIGACFDKQQQQPGKPTRRIRIR